MVCLCISITSCKNKIKDFTILGQYNIDNAYWADLFTRVKSWIKEIGMDMTYLPIFKLWGYIYFQSTNSLLLFGDIDLKIDERSDTSHQSF